MSCISRKGVDTEEIEERPKIFDQEEQVLKFSGLELNKELFVYDVPIELKGKEYKIHTYRCGDGNADDLVLLHGFAGCSALYYPMLKDLSKRFRVFCFDTIGMGLSSKEKFECQSTEETIDFLVGSIEKWRQAVGLDTFYLAGHSFGGHIGCHYTLRHQERVKKLTLLSPVGVTKHEKDPSFEDIKKRLGFVQKVMFKLIGGWVQKAWENKLTPGKFMNDHPWLGKYVVNNYVKKRFGVKDEEGKVLAEFMLNMLSLPEGAEVAVHYVLKPPFAAARIPLEDIIANDLSVPIDIFFGEVDYMDQTGAKRIPEKKKNGEFNYKIVPKAAHQLTMQNPKHLAEEMIVSVN